MSGKGVLCSLIVVAGCNAQVILGAGTGVAGRGAAAGGMSGQDGGGQPGGAQADGGPQLGGGKGAGGRVDGGAGGAGGGNSTGLARSWLPVGSTNDAATLPVSGSGSLCGTSTTMRRKSIVLTRAQADAGTSDLVLGQAILYATGTSEAELLATVTNKGPTMHCLIHPVPNHYRWVDSQGTAALVTNGPEVIGSEGDVGMTHDVQSCLAPGETGLIFDVQSAFAPQDVWAATASVELALTYDTDGSAPAAILAPQSYSFDGTNIAFHFKNVGTGPAGFPNGLAQFTSYVLLDSGGLPLVFGSMIESLDQSLTDVANPGDTGFSSNLDGILLSEFSGCAVAARAYIAFDKAK